MDASTTLSMTKKIDASTTLSMTEKIENGKWKIDLMLVLNKPQRGLGSPVKLNNKTASPRKPLHPRVRKNEF